MKKLYLSPDKKFLGVCGGVADYLNIDPVIIRIGVVTLALLTTVFPCIFIYIVLSFVFPQPPSDYYQIYQNTGKKLTKGNDKKLVGVCSGIADYLGADATIIRLAFALAMIFFGSGVMLYIVCALLMPQNPVQMSNNSNFNP